MKKRYGEFGYLISKEHNHISKKGNGPREYHPTKKEIEGDMARLK